MAMRAWLAYQANRTESVADFLARHADVRDVLEPLVTADDDDALASDAVDIGVHERELGPYQLVRVLDRGGMGVVFLARERSREAPLAIKLLHRPLALVGDVVERFRREAGIAKELRHPGLVRVLDSGTIEETPYLAMEFVAGAPLDAVLLELAEKAPADLRGEDLHAAVCHQSHREHPGPARVTTPLPGVWKPSYVATVTDLAIAVTEALVCLHAHGIVHRDLKPSNLLLCPDGRIVVTDYGLASAEGWPGITRTGEFFGTPFYVSPEQAMAKRVAIDARSDLFSFGAVLYEALTLRRPFGGETSAEVLAAILTKEPADPGTLNTRLGEDLATVVLHCLEKDPDRRYPSAEALLADLRALRDGEPIAARRPHWLVKGALRAARDPRRTVLLMALGLASLAVCYFAWKTWRAEGPLQQARAVLAQEEVEQLLQDALLTYGSEEAPRMLERIEQALLASPGHPELVATAAVLRLRGGTAAEALARLDQDAVPPSRLASRARAIVLRRLGRDAEAVTLETELGEPSAAFELFLMTMAERTWLTSTKEQAAAALDLAERAVAMSPRARPVFHFAIASAARKAGNKAAAARIAESLERLWPGSPGAWYWSGVALEIVDRERSVAAYRRACELQPVQWRAPYRMGTVLRALGRRDEAIAAFRSALASSPTHSFSHCMLCYTYLDQGDLAALRAQLDVWEALPDASAADLTVLASLLSQEQMPLDIRQRAPRVAQRVVTLSQRSLRGLETLARALARSGDQAGARLAAEDALAEHEAHKDKPYDGEIEGFRAEMRAIAAAGTAAPPPAPSTRPHR